MREQRVRHDITALIIIHTTPNKACEHWTATEPGTIMSTPPSQTDVTDVSVT